MTVASNRKVIYVYENFNSDEPNFLGTLFVENVRGRENYSFEYDADWLNAQLLEAHKKVCPTRDIRILGQAPHQFGAGRKRQAIYSDSRSARRLI